MEVISSYFFDGLSLPEVGLKGQDLCLTRQLDMLLIHSGTVIKAICALFIRSKFSLGVALIFVKLDGSMVRVDQA